MSWFTSKEERRGAARAHKQMVRETLASCDATLRHAAARERTTAGAGLVFKDRDNARVEPNPREVVRKSAPPAPATFDDDESLLVETAEYTVAQQRVLVGLIVEMRNWTRRKIKKAIDREFTQRELLRAEVGVACELSDLRHEVAAARRRVPDVPAIEAKPDRILDPLGFQEFVDLGHCKGRVRSKIDA
jgi:hypothetical protein